jgi:hypothetical protein
MTRGNWTEVKNCESCRVHNAILVTYGPNTWSNADKESGQCYSCGNVIIVEKCLAIYNGPTHVEIETRIDRARMRP